MRSKRFQRRLSAYTTGRALARAGDRLPARAVPLMVQGYRDESALMAGTKRLAQFNLFTPPAPDPEMATS